MHIREQSTADLLNQMRVLEQRERKYRGLSATDEARLQAIVDELTRRGMMERVSNAA